MTDASTRTALVALIERVEKAEGPSRELDAAITRCVHPDWRVDRDKFWSEGNHDAWCIRRDGRLDMPCDEALPRFTASIDAALTLVPEIVAPSTPAGRWPATVDIRRHDDGTGWASVQEHDAVCEGAEDELYVEASAATPALALCAAALRARAEPPA